MTPSGLHKFRQDTESHAKTAGITHARFQCKKCRQNKPLTGRKMVSPGFPKDGYVCGDCRG